MVTSGNRQARLRLGAYFAVSLLLALGVLSVLNRAATLHGEDGVLWSRGLDGLRAAQVEPGGPGSRAGIREEDRLESIGGTRVSESTQVRDTLWGRGRVPTSYQLQRAGAPVEVMVTPRMSGEESRVFYYLCLVGFLSLGAGALVVSRQAWSPVLGTHFLLLASLFSILVFSPSGRGGILDWSFYWGDVAGRILLPVLLFQFILQMGESSTGRPTTISRGLWIGSGLLLVWNLYLIPFRGALSFPDPVAVIALKDRLELAFLAVGCLASVILLLFRLFTTSQSRVRWRLQWLAFAAGAGLLPPLLLHLLPRALDIDSGVVAELSVLPLALIPLGFTAALLQERAVDLDRTLKGVARVSLEASVWLGVALLFSWSWRGWRLSHTNAGLPIEILLSLSMGAVVAFLLHRPLGRLVERILGGATPDITRALSQLQSELNGEVQLESLARNWIGRLRQVLKVERATLFVREGATGRFREEGDRTRKEGEEGSPASWTLDPLEMEWLGKQELVLLLGPGASRRLSRSTVEEWLQSGSRYLLPLVVQKRLNALLLVGAHRDGSPLESRELEIVGAAAAQAGRAVDGARLYGEIEKRIARERRLRAQSQGILEASPIGIILADAGGEVSAANRAAKTILGQESLLDRRLDEVLPKGLLWNLDRIGKGRGSTRGQGRASRFSFGAADGQVRIVNATRAPLAGEAGPGQVYTFDDITGEVEREKKMLQQDHLASVGLLASKVAHEVNTPLTGIASYAQMLMTRMRSKLPEMELLRRIETQAFRAAGIANSVLNMARRKEGETPRYFEAGAVIAECLILFEAHLKGKPIRIITERAASLPRLRGQGNRLEQAVMNLLLNAAEALPEGGEIRIRLLTEGDQLKIQVSDDGVGIVPDLLPRIFEPFVSSRAGGKGTGLGLAVVREVAKEFGGRVEVESHLGQGTTLTLLLPGESAHFSPIAQGA